ncbi:MULTISPECIES: SRPBCC family protein [unclassified Streptomyces]|uniref:SRPBCC family protein n=1 Tax=unclassified Streptomyces TaxID=2593676 RepID=UPI001BEA8ACC|nr:MULTISPECIES: SRPBCC family protein [unclassified Streptomyces]MBT2403332.1 SRPBCC family protein [Streptomyces sp. ISL-21]MBT2613629.1 SRPBCC family protein [Streptomyces sp. ISL-87]
MDRWDRRDRWDRWSRYRFRSVWDLDAPPALVYAALEQVEEYPSWWRQVRRVEPVDERTGTAYIRSVLPYEIRVTATERLRDPGRGLLEVALGGDLYGWARWTVRPRGGPGGDHTRALYEQEVEVRHPLMRRLSPPARPVFRLNHALMMRAGRRGLAARLAGPPEAV